MKITLLHKHNSEHVWPSLIQVFLTLFIHYDFVKHNALLGQV